ncbi:methyltransferase domain-containing protein [Pseudahrensia aquimaris]|uniref:Protein-L-isoaspartate O-methyltransferase n=1 Tax=Pseudahrensia aquimaris TaxID=744461 RepID=A0ABW3FHE9_9HYPH
MTAVQSEDNAGLMGFLMRLRAWAITDAALLKRVESVPHDRFVPVEHFGLAWSDSLLPLPCGQTMYSPDLMVRMLVALDVDPSHSVLEIGTGSGYLTGLLARSARKVKTLDRYKTLLNLAKQRLQALEISNVTFEQCDGRNGGRDDGLYDRIIADSSYDGPPRGLLDQLAAGGVVITAIGNSGEEQMLVRLTKIGSRFEREDLFPVRFTALEEGAALSL